MESNSGPEGVGIFLRILTNHGYYHFTNLNGTLSDGKYESVDQAWMQRIQGMLAEYR